MFTDGLTTAQAAAEAAVEAEAVLPPLALLRRLPVAVAVGPTSAASVT